MGAVFRKKVVKLSQLQKNGEEEEEEDRARLEITAAPRETVRRLV